MEEKEEAPTKPKKKLQRSLAERPCPCPNAASTPARNPKLKAGAAAFRPKFETSPVRPTTRPSTHWWWLGWAARRRRTPAGKKPFAYGAEEESSPKTRPPFAASNSHARLPAFMYSIDDRRNALSIPHAAAEPFEPTIHANKERRVPGPSLGRSIGPARQAVVQDQANAPIQHVPPRHPGRHRPGHRSTAATPTKQQPTMPLVPSTTPGSPLRPSAHAAPASSPSRRFEQDLSGLESRGAAGLAYLASLANHPTLSALAAPARDGEVFDPAAFAAQVMRDSGGSAAVSKSRCGNWWWEIGWVGFMDGWMDG